MKIALLTMVFNNNYGGMLQAYALMTSLKKLGHEPELLNLKKKYPYFKLPYFILRRVIKKCLLFGKMEEDIVPDWAYRKRIQQREQHNTYFIEKYIEPATEPIFNKDDLIKATNKNFDAFIVGSDQVWRPSMYDFFDHAFFDFVSDKSKTLVSYAPSFGVEEKEYTETQIQKTKKEIKYFNAISVRELSGVKLCKEYFNLNAVNLLDPTLLLKPQDYSDIVLDENTPNPKGDILVYLLDNVDNKQKSVDFTSLKLNQKPFKVNIDSSNKNISDFVYPSVFDWINGFIHAKFVITDSYHGCIFSILFNKPFIVYGNEKRGMARFNSILKLFNLEDRMILDYNEIDIEKLIYKTIDWRRINAIIEQERQKGFDYLLRALKNEQ